MKLSFIVSSLVLALAATGCTKSESRDMNETDLGAAVEAAPLADSEVDEILDEVAVPTEEEAAAKATSEIDASNADEEFARLMAEIEGDSDG